MSTRYRYHRATLQSYATFIGSLWHRREISKLTVEILTRQQIAEYCGLGVGGCYKGEVMLVPGGVRTLRGNRAAETLVAHEYGHHTAFNRANEPWDALEWGPKRWATYKGVCQLARRHKAYPGWETPLHYSWSPGEGWAQAYAYANGYDWNTAFASYWRPISARARAVIRNDVLHPWARNVTRTFRGSLRSGQSTRLRISTPLDGTARIWLTHAPALHVAMKLYLNRRAVRYAGPSHGRLTLNFTVCGSRQLSVGISARSGAGRYKLVIKRP